LFGSASRKSLVKIPDFVGKVDNLFRYADYFHILGNALKDLFTVLTGINDRNLQYTKPPDLCLHS